VTPAAAAAATPPPSAAAAAAVGSNCPAEGGGNPRFGMHDDEALPSDLVPPDFQRHCAAVAMWGGTSEHLMALAYAALSAMHAPGILGQAPVLTSWQRGGFYVFGLVFLVGPNTPCHCSFL
jgi:hypothetical protein